jgi:pyrophosphatase PpaX
VHMRSFDYYLFDADGTLVDTTEMIIRCFQHTARTFNHPPLEPGRVIANIGLPLQQQMAIYFGAMDEARFQKYRSVHMDYQFAIYPRYLALCNGVKEALEWLVGHGKKCAVVTSRLRNSLELFLKETGIDRYFDLLVTPENTILHKPHPQPVSFALDYFKCAPEDAVLVGDATYDVECGHSAGVKTVFVAWSKIDCGQLKLPPDYVINDMRELCAG